MIFLIVTQTFLMTAPNAVPISQRPNVLRAPSSCLTRKASDGDELDRSLPKSGKNLLRARTMDLYHVIKKHWNYKEFLTAQVQVTAILIIARLSNTWEPSYPRNDNHNMTLFWSMQAILFLVAICTLQRSESDRIQLLSRAQTEEWKGWMQFAFIMYHYYRAYSVYNVIRVFVSSYVWMTGFGNFLYFDRKQDFSITRACSMWLRINYFPILLSVVVGVEFDLFYIVPLHTTAFFITMFTCRVAKLFEDKLGWAHTKKNLAAVAACLAFHVIFYETPLVKLLEVCFGHEIGFRFQSDKYSAALGILSGFFWDRFTKFIQWSHASESGTFSSEQNLARGGMVVVGATLIIAWWGLFGYITDKFTYNPIHPFVFWLPLAGFLMIRNSSKILCQTHSRALEFFGKITLETYVLQFHVFMNHKVQNIPVFIPGAGADGNGVLKLLNMLLCGACFVGLAYWARKITVTTQTSVMALVTLLQKGPQEEPEEDKVALTSSRTLDKKDTGLDEEKLAQPKTEAV